MTTPGRVTGPPRNVDDLVREALSDDLPPEVEARLDRSVERFLAARADARRDSGASPFAFVREAAERIGASGLGRVLLPVASTLMFVAGLVALSAGHRSTFAQSFARINLSVSLSEAVREARSMSCTSLAGAPLASPDDLADAIYRRWALVRTEPIPNDRIRVVFRSRSDKIVYDLIVEGGTSLPREIRRIERPGETPHIATCNWRAPRDGETYSPPRNFP